MNPCSFVMNTDYLYYDKKNKKVKYIYIPSKEVCSGNTLFTDMAVDVSKMMTVTDAVLENKVLRAIIKDFNPAMFLCMLKDHLSENYSSRDESTAGSIRTGYESYPETSDIAAASEVMEVNEPSNPVWNQVENNIYDIQPDKKAGQGTGNNSSVGYKLFGSKKKKEQKPEILQPQQQPQ